MTHLQVLMTRHTVMVVGQTGGGKSVILQTLARAQTKMGKRTTMNILNPKVNNAVTALSCASASIHPNKQSVNLASSRQRINGTVSCPGHLCAAFKRQVLAAPK